MRREWQRDADDLFDLRKQFARTKQAHADLLKTNQALHEALADEALHTTSVNEALHKALANAEQASGKAEKWQARAVALSSAVQALLTSLGCVSDTSGALDTVKRLHREIAEASGEV